MVIAHARVGWCFRWKLGLDFSLCEKHGTTKRPTVRKNAKTVSSEKLTSLMSRPVWVKTVFFWKRWCHWPAAASRPQTTTQNNDGQWICITATEDDQPEIFSSSRTTSSSKQEWTITHGAGLGSTVDRMPSPAFLFSHLVFWVGWLGYWARKPLLLLYLLPHYPSSCTNNTLDKCSQVYHPPSSIHANLELGLRKLHTESTILYNFIEYLFWFSSSNGENVSSMAEKHFPFMFRDISCPPKVFLFYSFSLFQIPCQRLQFIGPVRLSLGLRLAVAVNHAFQQSGKAPSGFYFIRITDLNTCEEEWCITSVRVAEHQHSQKSPCPNQMLQD